MNRLSVLSVLPALFLAGCMGMQMAPSAAEIRTVALVALSMNVPFRNTEAPKDEQTGLKLKDLVKTTSETVIVEESPEAMQELLVKTRDAFFTHLGGVKRWSFLSQADLTAHPAFQTAKKTPGWSRSLQGREAAPGLLPTSLDDLSARVVTLGGPKGPSIREMLAALARDLGVDAVALVDLDMAYTLTGNTSGGLLEGRPDVAARLAVVTKEGDTAMKATNTDRFITDAVRMLRRGKNLVELDFSASSDPAKAAKAYALALNSAATQMAEDLDKKLSEGR